MQAICPLQKVVGDLLGPFPKSSGRAHVMAFIDALARWPEAMPMPAKDAGHIAHALHHLMLTRYGAPELFLAGCGSEFKNALMRKLCNIIGADKIFSAPHHPQSHGVVERLNRALLDRLAFLTSTTSTGWANYVENALFSMRATPHDTIGYSPAEAFLGRSPALPIDLALSPEPDIKQADQQKIMRDRLRSLGEMQDQARKNAGNTRSRAIAKLNKSRRESTLEAGRYARIRAPQASAKAKSFQRDWHGPYKLTCKLNAKSEWIAAGAFQGKAIERRAHEDNIKPHCDASGRMIKDKNAPAFTPSDMPDARNQPMPQHDADPNAALQRKLPGRPRKARRAACKGASTLFALDPRAIGANDDHKHPAIVRAKRAEDESEESRER